MVRPLLVNVALVGLNMLPPVTVTPAPLTVVTPVSTPPVRIPRPLTVVPFNKLPVLTLPVVPKFKLSLSSTSILPFFTRVSMLLLEPTTSTACPNGFCTVLPSAAFSAKPEVDTPVMALFKSPMFAALVSVVPPLATPEMTLSPALIPVDEILTPLLKLALSRPVKLLAKPSLIPSPVDKPVVVKLLSVSNLISSPKAKVFLRVPPLLASFTLNLMPLAILSVLVPILVVLVEMLLVLVVTCWLVLNN